MPNTVIYYFQGKGRVAENLLSKSLIVGWIFEVSASIQLTYIFGDETVFAGTPPSCRPMPTSR